MSRSGTVEPIRNPHVYLLLASQIIAETSGFRMMDQSGTEAVRIRAAVAAHRLQSGVLVLTGAESVITDRPIYIRGR